jgi:hypothetical protein
VLLLLLLVRPALLCMRLGARPTCLLPLLLLLLGWHPTRSICRWGLPCGALLLLLLLLLLLMVLELGRLLLHLLHVLLLVMHEGSLLHLHVALLLLLL